MEKYPTQVIQPVVLAAWPLHLFTLCLVGICVAFHHGDRLGEIVAYTVVAYASYVVLPLLFVLDRRIFEAFVKMVAIVSALPALPAFVGAMHVDSIFGVELSNKPSYASFSGIIASGGVFEHPEGQALQMAVGLFCCFYGMRKTGGLLYLMCFLLTLAGLVVSQGRGAIFGVLVASLFCLLPELFRRSRPVFFGSLALCLVFPFLILPQLGEIPGVKDYLRLERGLSGREVAWRYAFTLIEEKPWTGHGFGSSGELSKAGENRLSISGYSGAGTTFHNTFITKAVELGIIATAVYMLLYILPLFRICEPTCFRYEQEVVRSILILTLTASLFRDYNIGGVRSTSILVAVFLGLANLWPLVVDWQPTAHDTVPE